MKVANFIFTDLIQGTIVYDLQCINENENSSTQSQKIWNLKKRKHNYSFGEFLRKINICKTKPKPL